MLAILQSKKQFSIIVLFAVFVFLAVSITPVHAALNVSGVFSSDSGGATKTSFITTDNVYAHVTTTGSGSLTVRFYVVSSSPSSGGTLTDVSGGYETSTISGASTVEVWAAPTAVGTYYVVADANANGVYDNTGSPKDAASTLSFTIAKASPSISTTLSSTSITVGNSVHDTATLTSATSDAGGTVTYYYYTDVSCGNGETQVGLAVSVSNGVVQDSSSQTFNSAGSFGWKAVYSGDAKNNGATSSCEPLTVNKASPTLTTAVSDSGSITVGSSATDTATLTGAFSPSGTMTFNVYSDDQCNNLVTSFGVSGVDSVSVSSASTDSDSFTPAGTGTFYWTASYSGDANNHGASTTCGDSGETLTVGKATPNVDTDISPSSVTAADKFTDSVTVTGFSPTGTVDFKLYTKSDCSGTLVDSDTSVQLTSGSAGSKDFGPVAAADYGFIASYSGDDNNKAADSVCEPLTVGKASVTFSTQISSTVGVVAGDSVTDQADVSGGYSPTGTVDFTFYTGSTGCSGSSTTQTDVSLVSGQATSQSSGALATDSYSYMAHYSGDDNNEAKDSACEPLTVGKASPTVSTEVHDSGDNVVTSITAGDSASDLASFTGGYNPGGTVTYNVYSGTACSGTPLAHQMVTIVTPGVIPESQSFSVFTSAGNYRLEAVYSGDGNNNGYTSSCEELTVVPAVSPTTLDFCPLQSDQFKLIFTPNSTVYKLSASNPGQFRVNILQTGAAGSVTLDITLPYPFVTQGAVPIHVYGHVTDSGGCFVPDTEIYSSKQIVTLNNYTTQEIGSTVTLHLSFDNPGTVSYVTIHLDYGLKGTSGYTKSGNNALGTPNINDGTAYEFSVDSASTSISNVNVFKKDPGFGGLVLDTNGNGVQGVTVSIYGSDGKLMGSATTDQDGWYSYSYKHTGKAATFTLKLPAYSPVLSQQVILKANGYVVVNFTVPSST